MNNKLEVQAEQLSILEVLGFEVVGRTFEECVDDLIQKYILLSMAVKQDTNDSFKKELSRVLKPSN